VAGFCKHCNELSGSIKKAGYLLKISVTISFSNNILHRGVSIKYEVVVVVVVVAISH
jgi:hypothetical protein